MPPIVAEDRIRRGIVERWCPLCDEWKPATREHFQPYPNGKFFRRCRPCVARARRPDSGKIVLTKVQKHIDWMVGVVGWHETRRRLGVSKGTLSNWRNGRVRRMTKASAAKVIKAAVLLREEIRLGIVKPLTRYLTKGHCAGCGGDLRTYMDGCGQCWDRRRRREQRSVNGRSRHLSLSS